MSMSTFVFYKNDDQVRGVTVKYKFQRLAGELRAEFGQDRGALVEWVEGTTRDIGWDDDSTWHEDHTRDRDLFADEFLFIDGNGVIQDVTGSKDPYSW